MADDSGLFESAWLKWSWAVAHAETLKAHVEFWRDAPQRQTDLELWKQYDAKRHCIDVFVAKIEPLPIEWGLVLGDIAHNFRSCLDHIAWGLVSRGRKPPETLKPRARGKIYFPIYGDRLDYNAALRSKLPGVRRADLAVVRRYQPYKHGKRKRDVHAFALLASISNKDKHRTVQPVPALPRHGTYNILDTRDCIVTGSSGKFLAGPLEVGTKLAPIRVRKTGPHPDVAVEGQLAAYPTLDYGVHLEQWLTETRGLTAALLGELSDPPVKLLEKLTITA